MTKKLKKSLILCLTVILIANYSIPVFAADAVQEAPIISIDAQKVVNTTGKTLDEVLGINGMMRAKEMPDQTWDWGNGNYSGTFEIDYEYSYTKYYFTGYSQYYVDTKASRDKWTAASDKYTVYLMKGSNQGTIVTSYEFDSTDWTKVRFYNLDSGTKYAVCFAKANDGSTLSGEFIVSH